MGETGETDLYAITMMKTVNHGIRPQLHHGTHPVLELNVIMEMIFIQKAYVHHVFANVTMDTWMNFVAALDYFSIPLPILVIGLSTWMAVKNTPFSMLSWNIIYPCNLSL